MARTRLAEDRAPDRSRRRAASGPDRYLAKLRTTQSSAPVPGGRRVRVRLYGEVDAVNAERYARDMKEALGSDTAVLEIDMSRVDHISRTGTVRHCLRGPPGRRAGRGQPRQPTGAHHAAQRRPRPIRRIWLVIASATGRGSATELRAAGAHHVLDDLTDVERC